MQCHVEGAHRASATCGLCFCIPHTNTNNLADNIAH